MVGNISQGNNIIFNGQSPQPRIHLNRPAISGTRLVIYQLYKLLPDLTTGADTTDQTRPRDAHQAWINYSLFSCSIQLAWGPWPLVSLLDYNDKFMPITLIAARDLADWECYLGRWQLVLVLITVCPARLGWDLTRLCTTQFRLWDVNWLEWASLVMSYCCTDKGDELW